MPKQNNQNTASWDARQVREAQQSAQSSTRKKKKKQQYSFLRGFLKTAAYLLFVVLTSAALAGGGWLLFNDLCSLNKEPVNTTVVVKEGDTMEDVARELHEKGLIEYEKFFCFAGKFLHAEEIIEPGEYHNITSDLDYRALIRALHHYQTYESVKVMIPEGSTVREIIDLLAENEVCDRAALEDAAANADFGDRPYIDEEKLGQVNRLEGFLFPDTYEFYKGSDPVETFGIMLDNFDSRITEQMRNDIQDTGYSLKEIVILASMIEKESNDDNEERANIASVLYNRLRTTDSETYGMLQMDSTVDYALYLDGKDRSEFSIEYESPYNTYTFAGFPAGAICNPGLAAINAAIYPNQTDYYYFAAGVDGRSHFFTNLYDHNEFGASDMYKPA